MKIHYDRLYEVVTEILEAFGESSDNAKTTAETFLKAEARGVTTHGVHLLSPIWDRVKAKQLFLPTKAKVIKDDGAVAVIDGGDGLGPVAGMLALKTAIDKARQYGVATVLVRNTNNVGALAYYTEIAAKEGMIAIMSCNAAPAMAPWGGAKAFLGTNPLAIGIYTGQETVFSADMATSVVARGKIRKASRNSEVIPDNWATDCEGNFTTDPDAALKGALLPMGGPKGSAIALAIDIISGMLSGAKYAPYLKSFHTPEGQTGVGVSMIVIDIRRFMDLGIFEDLMKNYIKSIKDMKKAKGFDVILLPGEAEQGTENKCYQNGIDLDDNTISAINKLLVGIGSVNRLGGRQ